MLPFQRKGNHLLLRSGYETLLIEPWGKDGVRVRATQQADVVERPGALLCEPPGADPRWEVDREGAVLTNGRVRVELSAAGRLRFFNAQSGALLLEEPERYFWSYPARAFTARPGSDLYQIEASFSAQPGEAFFGLGQHHHGRLNQKGCVIRLQQTNTEIAIPFVMSSRGYGFLWNNPSLGRVELAENATRWISEGSRQVDYYLTAGTPAEILSAYTLTTGRPPLLPGWALGFWQSKLRYRDQAEVLAVAREYQKRGLPLSVLVIDYFHWTMMGDWKFDPQQWPDPAGMVRELRQMGVEVMVSVWGAVNPLSENFAEMNQRGLLVRADRNINVFHSLTDRYPDGPTYLHYYDATNPEARRYLWEKIKAGYHDLGVRGYWLDADEPEITPVTHDNLRYHLGSALEVGCIYPLLHQQGFYEGDPASVTLSRSAWAGSQRTGAVIWSGDIPSTFDFLSRSVRAGLSMSASGIPWWTTDIGGFLFGDTRSDTFRELIVRWFQYGVFCPVFRVHGLREPQDLSIPGAGISGAPNEVWSFGETATPILSHLLHLRQGLRPYLDTLNQAAHETGLPPMRPLWMAFPGDPAAWTVEDAFLLGPDLLAAPITAEGQRSRAVYLPAGADWMDAWTGAVFSGGQTIQCPAPLEHIPVFWRTGSPFARRFDQIP